MEETFETPFYLRRAIEVKFSTITAEWQISGKSSTGRHDVAAYVTYGTDRANAYKILEDTLNLKDARIYDTIEDAEGNKSVFSTKGNDPRSTETAGNQGRFPGLDLA